ncbi:MAG: hypothetical protein ACRC9K_12360 [Afipia sp.]
MKKRWKPLSEKTPKDRVLLGCWIDARGDEVPVLIRYEASNQDSNLGFIGVAGQRYGAGGITGWLDFTMPSGAIPKND